MSYTINTLDKDASPCGLLNDFRVTESFILEKGQSSSRAGRLAIWINQDKARPGYTTMSAGFTLPMNIHILKRFLDITDVIIRGGLGGCGSPSSIAFIR